jgi:hypothetical protein
LDYYSTHLKAYNNDKSVTEAINLQDRIFFTRVWHLPAVNVLIMKASINSGHVMDLNWQMLPRVWDIATIQQQTALDDTLATTDILIIASGL